MISHDRAFLRRLTSRLLWLDRGRHVRARRRLRRASSSGPRRSSTRRRPSSAAWRSASRPRNTGCSAASPRAARATKAGGGACSRCARRRPTSLKTPRPRQAGAGRRRARRPARDRGDRHRQELRAAGRRSAQDRRRLLHPHHARRPHRHPRPQRRGQDHADQAADRRDRAGRRRGAARHRHRSRSISTSGGRASTSSAPCGRRWRRPAAIPSSSTAGRATSSATCATSCSTSGRRPCRCAPLSGGERARLMLAKLFAEPGNLIVLDEPTNDLDMDTLDLLQDVLSDYDGTLLLVSHDRDFLDRLVDQHHRGRRRRRRGGICRRLQRLRGPARRARGAGRSRAKPSRSAPKRRGRARRRRRASR